MNLPKTAAAMISRIGDSCFFSYAPVEQHADAQPNHPFVRICESMIPRLRC